MDPVVKGFAMVCLILGLLKFAKEAPDLVKTLFSNGGNLFAGMNLKPGVKKRIEENDYAMKGISTVTGGVGGMVGNAFRAGNEFYRRHNQGTGNAANKAGAIGGALGAAALSLPRGLVTGARAGFNNSTNTLSAESIAQVADSGLAEAQRSGRNARTKREEHQEFLKHPIIKGGEYLEELSDKAEEKYKETRDRLTGRTAAGTSVVELDTQMSKMIGSMTGLADKAVESLDEVKKKLSSDIYKGDVTFNGKVYSLNGERRTEIRQVPNGLYDANNNPIMREEQVEIDVGSRADLLKDIKAQKNAIIAKELNDKYKQVVNTQAATLGDYMAKQMSLLGSDTIAKINADIRSKTNNEFDNVNDLLKDLSNANSDITVSKVEALDAVKSVLDSQKKAIESTANYGPAPKTNNKQNNQSGGNK